MKNRSISFWFDCKVSSKTTNLRDNLHHRHFFQTRSKFWYPFELLWRHGFCSNIFCWFGVHFYFFSPWRINFTEKQRTYKWSSFNYHWCLYSFENFFAISRNPIYTKISKLFLANQLLHLLWTFFKKIVFWNLFSTLIS